MPTPFVPAENVGYLQVFMRLFGQKVENTFHYVFPGAITATDADDLMDKFATLWETHVMQHLSHDLTFVGLKLTDLTSETAPAYERTFGNVPGSDTSNALPGNVTLCVKRSTAGRGRSARGRVYLPGIPGSHVVGDTMNTDEGNALTGDLDTVRVSMSESTVTPAVIEVICSTIHNGAPRTTALIEPVLVYNLFDYQLDSQRRRLAGRGQ